MKRKTAREILNEELTQLRGLLNKAMRLMCEDGPTT